MNYYLDTEFIEGPQDKKFLGIKYGKTKPTIDLISIGIVCEDGRAYYAISNEFNLDEAWNRFQLSEPDGKSLTGQYQEKEYWIRENVLFPMFAEMTFRESLTKENGSTIDMFSKNIDLYNSDRWERDCMKHSDSFNKSDLKRLIEKYGKSNKEIAEEIFIFTCTGIMDAINNKPVFYAYYADYDWVVFCWLFGKMIDLPKGFPKYCRNLKQELDKICDDANIFHKKYAPNTEARSHNRMKQHKNYPKQENKHNALDDAMWNNKLHEFIKGL